MGLGLGVLAPIPGQLFTPPPTVLSRTPQGEAGGPQHHLAEHFLEHSPATAEPRVEVRSHLPQEGNSQKVRAGPSWTMSRGPAGHIDAAHGRAIWRSSILQMGKLRSGLFLRVTSARPTNTEQRFVGEKTQCSRIPRRACWEWGKSQFLGIRQTGVMGCDLK